MLAAASFALIVALAIVAVPRLMYVLLLGPTWRIPAYRQWAARTLVVAFCAALVLSGAMGLPAAAAVAAAVVTCELLYYSAIAGKARRLQLACRGLLLPATREASLTYVNGEIAHRKKQGGKSTAHYAGYARTAIVLANTIDAAGLSGAALGVLEDIDPSRLDSRLAAMRAQNLAAFLVRAGRREAAREVLAGVRRPIADPVYEDAIAALETLLVALEGDPKDAEARARRALEETKLPTVQASWQAALAHALAAQGERDEAVVVLRAMQSAMGDVALDRVTRHAGAASPLAEQLRAETGAPYR